jgi:hypothetical protein
VIDPTQHEVRPLGHQRFHCKHYTIRRSPVDLKPSLAALDRAHRVVQRERMARRALLPVGRDDGYFTERLGGFDETLQPKSEDAIIVRAQQSQRWKIPARWRHSTFITSHASLNSLK